MSDVASLARLLAYDAWANREALASLRRMPAPPPRALRALGHVAACERLWLERLRGEQRSLPVWPDLALDACARLLAEMEASWRGYLAALSPEDLAAGVAYVNTQGASFTNTVEEILTHVVIHSAYHRGQVAAVVREAGGDPALTDFIHGVRTDAIEFG